MKKLAGRVKAWVRLRRAPARDKRLAVLVYGFPPGVGATGTAALLNVPKSLEVGRRACGACICTMAVGRAGQCCATFSTGWLPASCSRKTYQPYSCISTDRLCFLRLTWISGVGPCLCWGRKAIGREKRPIIPKRQSQRRARLRCCPRHNTLGITHVAKAVGRAAQAPGKPSTGLLPAPAYSPGAPGVAAERRLRPGSRCTRGGSAQGARCRMCITRHMACRTQLRVHAWSPPSAVRTCLGWARCW